MDLSEVKTFEQQNEVADVLRRAKVLIGTPEKWARYAAVGERHCAGNAIWMAEGGVLYAKPTKAEATFCAAIGVPDFIHIYHWNDAPERTHAEVMAAFDRAIALSSSSPANAKDER